MSYSTSASSPAAKSRRRSSRKANANHFFGGVAVAGLVLGCAWTVYANIFAASIYPTLAGGNFDAPVTRHKQSVAAQPHKPSSTTCSQRCPNRRRSLPRPRPSPPLQLMFDDRFAAAAPQGVAPRPQAETMQLASASPSVEVTKPVERKLEIARSRQTETSFPAPARSRPSRRPARGNQARQEPGASVKDMAQRAKAAVMSIASGDRPTWSKNCGARNRRRDRCCPMPLPTSARPEACRSAEPDARGIAAL